jgi:hypothetical protein
MFLVLFAYNVIISFLFLLAFLNVMSWLSFSVNESEWINSYHIGQNFSYISLNVNIFCFYWYLISSKISNLECVIITYFSLVCVVYFLLCGHLLFMLFLLLDSAVGIVTDYGLGDQGVRVWDLVGARIFTSPCHPDRLWGPPSLLSNG